MKFHLTQFYKTLEKRISSKKEFKEVKTFLKIAKKFSKKGDFIRMDLHLSQLSSYCVNKGIVIDDYLKTIRKIAQKNNPIYDSSKPFYSNEMIRIAGYANL